MSSGKVSVIIPTHNRIDLLRRAIESVLIQTYQNIEVVVVNDNSNDGTQDYLTKMSEVHSNLRFVTNASNLGASNSRNIAIQYSTGHYITGLDDDDEFEPTRIEKLVGNFDEKYSFVTSLNRTIHFHKEHIVKVPTLITLERILDSNVSNQVLTLKQRILEVGSYNENRVPFDDYDLWLRLIIRYGNGLCIQETLQNIYIDHDNKRITNLVTDKFNNVFGFYKKYKGYFSYEQRKFWLSKLFTFKSKQASPRLFATLDQKIFPQFFFRYSFRTNIEKELDLFSSTLNSLLSFFNSSDRKIVFYGFGTYAKLIYPHLKEKVVGYHDKEKKLENNGLPLLKIDDFIERDDVVILVTFHSGSLEIKNKLQKKGLYCFCFSDFE